MLKKSFASSILWLTRIDPKTIRLVFFFTLLLLSFAFPGTAYADPQPGGTGTGPN